MKKEVVQIYLINHPKFIKKKITLCYPIKNNIKG